VRLLVVHLLAPLLRGVVATSIAILLSVLLALSRSRAVVDTEHAGLSAGQPREPARCEAARHDALDGRTLPSDAPSSPAGDTSSDGEDGEDEGSDEASDGDVPGLPGQRTWPSARAQHSHPSHLRGGALAALRTRLGEAPEAPPPRV
jgi:hypothetical protein